MVVTIPEKTLEHWISQYVTYRYRSHSSLWWPAFGQDIDIRSLPSRPGKAIQLEVKTASVTGANQHDIHIDLRQLRNYRRRRFERQPFYVFPRPFWRGTLERDAARRGDQVTEYAFKRSGEPQWFGNWMIVLTAEQVEATLRPLPSDQGKRRLVRFRVDGVGAVTSEWANTAAPAYVYFSDFWNRLNRCGQPDWPQIVRLPTGYGDTMNTPAETLVALQTAAGDLQGRRARELTTFGSDGKVGFARVPDDRQDSLADDVLTSDRQVAENRQIVFIDAQHFV